MEMMESYQMIIICAMIMVGLIGEANLLIASFAGKIESREILEVILLLLEALLAGIIMFIIQKIFYHGDMQDLLNFLNQYVINHKGASCILLISVGLIVLVAGTIISLKIVQRKRI